MQIENQNASDVHFWKKYILNIGVKNDKLFS